MSTAATSNTQYERMMQFIMTAVLVSICICGVFGNSIVLGVGVVKRRYQNDVTNCFIMNLALTDLLFLLISVPLTTYLGVAKFWNFGQYICKMNLYFAHVLLQAVCCTLAAMSIDRYLNTAHELWYRKYRKSRNAQISCLCIWIISLIFMFPYEHFSHIEKNQTNQSSTTSDCNVHGDDSAFSSCMFTFGFYYVLPLSIIGLCYLGVFLHLRRTGYRMVKRLSGIPRQTMILKKRRVQRILLGLTLAFALCWLPIHVLEIVKCFDLLSSSFIQRYYYALTTARMIAHALSYFNSCLNPFLYALLNRRFFSNSLKRNSIH